MVDITCLDEIKFDIKPNEILQFVLHVDNGSIVVSSSNYIGKWHKENKIITYIPEKDFAGIDSINFKYWKDSKEYSTNISIHVANAFKPRARIIKIIGQELISNDVIALVELIKNSYDADAEEVEIHLNNIFDEKGELVIKDSGTGMTYEKVLNVWLEPATPDKKSKGEQTFSDCYKRRFLANASIPFEWFRAARAEWRRFFSRSREFLCRPEKQCRFSLRCL